MSAPVPRLPTPKPTAAPARTNWAAVTVAMICDGDVNGNGTDGSYWRSTTVANVEALAAEAERWEAHR